MKEYKKQYITTALLATVCGLTFACSITALQADIPKELPEELTPVEYVATEAEPIVEQEPTEEPVVEVQPTALGEFKLTAYCTCEKCCGQWADGITYTGTQATAGKTVAVDPKVIPLGSTLYIDGAEYVAEDIGGAIKGKRIDVLFPTHQEALRFGVQYAEVAIKK